jgi:beta-glucanase (GH16 family)
MELHKRIMELDESQDARQFQVTPTTASADQYEEERKELEQVLNFQGINRSANMVRFLSFICNKYFEGEADDIRERTVAVEALGRKEANFDSHADPIVRVTARDLRKKLGEFYESEGKDHSLQIILPRGRYIPQFIRRSEQIEVSDLTQDPLSSEQAEAVEGPVAETSSPVIGKGEVENEKPRVPASFSTVNTKFVFRTVCIAVLIAFGFFAGFFLGRHPRQPATVASVPFDWGDPVWSYKFDGQAQQLPDSSRWTYDTGNQNGWGNHEVEIYCSPKSDLPKGCDPRHPNAFLDGAGHLVIRAEKNASGVWTSARITTRGLKTFQYGRVEARMKLPVGAGLWPSFWMLGANFPTVGWPSSGSVGMVENVSLGPHSDGLGPTVIRSTLHGPRYSGGNGLWHDFKLPNGGRIDDGNFHTYGVIWSPGMMQFYVDDPANIFFVQSASNVPQGGEWVFDHPFSLVMNLAVGGDWPGNPDSTTPNPSDILVDYVRVYKIPNVPAPSIEWDPVRVSAGSATAGIIKLRAKSGAGRVYLSCSTEPATAVCTLTTSVVNFSDSFSQEDSLTISTDSFTEKGRVQAPPGSYKLTITATTISGNRSQLTLPFEVTDSK